jgi:hypothetical protein
MKTVFSYTNSKGKQYYLNMKEVNLKSGRKQTIYFFSLDQRETGIEAVPAGYELIETSRTKMPVLKKA